jgi:creatinine amidohydrolase
MISERTNARQWSAATWEEIGSIERSRAIAIFPVGAIEAHGPHLALATDVVIAEAMARRGAELLAERGTPVIVMPSLAYTVAGFAAGFHGTITIRSTTLTALVTDVIDSLARQGFPALAIANAHLDPGHLEALHAAVDSAPIPVVFPDLTRRPWSERLGEEFRSGACHAGCFEGSIVLTERPEWLRVDVAAALPPVPISLSKAIREGKKTFEESGLDRAYCGDPAAATPEEGRTRVDALGAILADALLDAGVVA